MRLFLIVMTVCFSAIAATQPMGEVFTNQDIGLQFTKPAAWHYVSAEHYVEDVRDTNLKDRRLEELKNKNVRAPLVAISKFPDSYQDAVNPTFKIHVNGYGQFKGQSPTDIIAIILRASQRAFKDFKLEEGPVEVTISGIRSGYARISYTPQTHSGRTFSGTSEIWIVPRQDTFLTLGAVTPRNDETDSRGEIAAMMQSMKIVPRADE